MPKRGHRPARSWRGLHKPVGRAKKGQISRITPTYGYDNSALPASAILYSVIFFRFLFVLTVVVFVHELGHFLVARWCGVAVKTFSIGFGPEIAGFNDRHGTRWRLSWIPLGGYVKFIDDENAASAGQKSLEQLSPEERARSFQGKAVGGPRGGGRRRSDRQFHPGDRDLYGDFRPVRRAHHRRQGRYRQSGKRRRAGRFPAGRPGDQHRRQDHRELRRNAAHRRHEPRPAAPFRGRPRRPDRRASPRRPSARRSPTISATSFASGFSEFSGALLPTIGR